jgi:hypothetical protein
MKINHTILLLLLIVLGCSTSDTGKEQESPIMQESPMIGDVSNEDPGAKLMGDFIDVAHPTSGMAIVNAERTELELIDFKSDDGPILELYLATDSTAENYITLGVLQGLEGNFTYLLPQNINFDAHKYLIVWCVTFEVDFGHAVLE